MKARSAKKRTAPRKSRRLNNPCCETMRVALADPTIPLVFIPKFREYGIRVLDGGTSYIAMKYCPWCRRKLPSSLRDQWLKRIRKLGFEPGDKKIPSKYLDASWYSSTSG